MDVQSDLPNKIPGVNQQPEPVENSTASGDTYNLSGDFRNATINIKSILQADAHWAINREYMLKRIRKDWLEGVLEPARISHSLIALNMQYQAGLVESPWTSVVQRKENAPSTPLTSNHILNTFDSANGNLLILGEPGAGKTITLLQLANELVRRAETDPNRPIPIVLNLSSWDEEHMPLENWLTKELRGKYFVPQLVAEAWIAKDALTLLLDGLDEVPEDKRPACIAAINSYRHGHGPAQIVVCSRRTDYENQTQRMQLDGAILLLPLGKHQIDQILAEHRHGQAVADTLDQDASLRQLARSPLMLNIMILASQEVSTHDWSHIGNIVAHRERLFDVYLKSVFNRRRPSQNHSEELTLRVLPWLAQNMAEQGQTVFLFESLGPNWLKGKGQHLSFHLGIRLLNALLLGGAISLIYLFGQAALEDGLKMMLAVSMAALATSFVSLRLNNLWTIILNIVLTALACTWARDNFSGGMIAGLILGIPGGATAIAMREPRMTDQLHWSWKRTLAVMMILIVVEIAVGMFLYRTSGISTLSFVTDVLLLCALPIGTAITLSFGRRPSLRMAPTVKPNQGYWQSLRNAAGITLFLILILLPLSLPAGISLNLSQGHMLWEADALITSLLFVVATISLVALPLSLFFGGAACLQQLLVRSILTGVEKLPWDLVSILDNATDRIILQRVGGGYIFQHRLLQDYFADAKHKPSWKEEEDQ